MKIGKLSDLMSVLSGGADNQVKQRPASENVAKVYSLNQGADAARLSQDLGRAQDESSDRAAKVAEIKKQVDSGEYKPDSRDVAKAVIQDLFV